MKLKLGKCGQLFSNKDGQLIELVLMNMWTSYDVLFSSFCSKSMSHKQYGKDFIFDIFCDFFLSRINKNCLMKGCFVENANLTCSKARSRRIIKNVVKNIIDSNV